jgi:hypothetical protein
MIPDAATFQKVLVALPLAPTTPAKSCWPLSAEI